MAVIGTVGLPGSGKGEFASVANDLDIPVVTMGDVIRTECRRRGLDPADHHGEVAQALREEDGPLAIAERSIPIVRDALEHSDTVVVDGLRSAAELQQFRTAFGDEFELIAVEASFEERAQRIDARGRDNSANETLRQRDERELGFGLGEAIEQADRTIENDGSLEQFHDQVHEILQ
ncbi:MAG: AAA family ATPase [Halobacteriales archaeon]|nr:AAA family ATPase [Halobacteriales archaeon]